MDLDQVLRILYAEKEKLDKVIASLEELQASLEELQAIHSDSAAPHRRGRKSKGQEERREVSARMKRFWAEQRKPHSTRP
jgi:hypothetical protein